MEKPLLKEIWRNELAQWNKGGWKGDLGFGLSSTLMFIVFLIFYFINGNIFKRDKSGFQR